MLSLGGHGISGLWGGKCFCRVQSSKTAFRQIAWKKARKASVRYNQDISRYGKLIKVQRVSHFTSERWPTSVPRTPTPSWSKYSLTCAEPTTAKINRNMIWFDKSRVCPRANKVLTPTSGTVQNASAAYLSLWWLHWYSKAGGKAVECEWVSGNTSPATQRLAATLWCLWDTTPIEWISERERLKIHQMHPLIHWSA